MKDKLCVALDVNTYDQAFILATLLQPYVGVFKVGMQLFTQEGPRIIKMLKDKNCKVFLDMKYHDIPNTVKHAVLSAVDLGVDIINMHSLGGYDMLRSAVVGVDDYCSNHSIPRPKLIGVTVLTSTSQATLENELLISTSLPAYVNHLASLCRLAGLDGIVCSPQDLRSVRSIANNSLYYITPGVRPREASMDDQKRVMTPREAILEGSDLIVIGRPIIEAEDPQRAAITILQRMEGI